jgi:hypothetical protein
MSGPLPRLFVVAFLVVLSACGGSSSETPWPLEPGPGELDRPLPNLPHPEPIPSTEDEELEGTGQQSTAPQTWGVDQKKPHTAFPGAESADAGAP